MNNKPVAWMVDGVLFNSLGAALNISFDIEQPCIPLYTNPAKTLTDEEITIVKETLDNYVCTIKMEIDQEKQAFKGYEHCSNLPSLRSELKDAKQALAILRKAQEK